MSAKAELHYDGGSVTLPMVEGSEGERAIVIENLRAETGLIHLGTPAMRTRAPARGRHHLH